MKEEATTEVQNEGQTEGQTPDQAPGVGPNQSNPDLTVQDLQALKNIIDVASGRGAFKPNEMVVVGQTYNKLEQFLTAIAEQQKEQQ